MIETTNVCIKSIPTQTKPYDNKAIATHTTANHLMAAADGISCRKWPLNGGHQRLVLKRSTSADSVLMADSYQVIGSGSLSAHTYGFCRSDQCTQTPEEWEESDKIRYQSTLKGHKTESVQNTALQRRPDTKFVSNRDQSTQSIECDSYKATQVLVTSGVSPTKSITKSGPITIPTKLCVDSSRSANSLEELNQEIENLVLKGISDYDNQLTCDKVPEGHRAPVFELLAIKAHQNMNRVGSSGEESSDLSQSESPIFATEIISTTVADPASDVQHNYSMSPKMNKFLTREPPDGCEKIKIVNEDDRMNAINYNSGVGGFMCPVQPSSGFVLLPSRSSAFLPIFKPNDFSADYLKNRINYRKS